METGKQRQMKNVLVIYYTQTGQQKEILENLVKPLELEPEITINWYAVEPIELYPFPWDNTSFFDVFPESFLQIPTELKPIPDEILNQDFDLIILGYQVWYLSPSIPINSFLKTSEANRLLSGKPVVTVIGCRNMWVMAQEKMKKLVVKNGAKLVGNIALVDRHINHISLVTIVHWMMKGRKDSYLGIFPKPGVSDEDIAGAEKFGLPIASSLIQNNFENLQKNLIQLKAVKVKPLLVFIDKRGNFIFSKWSKIIRKKGLPKDPKRKPWLKAFYYYLSFALWIIAPIVAILFLILSLPFFSKIRRQTRYYQSVELK